MTKSDLVKIGVPSEQADSMRRLRHVRQILDQRDAQVNRINATAEERIRELLSASDVPEEPSPAAATA